MPGILLVLPPKSSMCINILSCPLYIYLVVFQLHPLLFLLYIHTPFCYLLSHSLSLSILAFSISLPLILRIMISTNSKYFIIFYSHNRYDLSIPTASLYLSGRKQNGRTAWELGINGSLAFEGYTMDLMIKYSNQISVCIHC